jgi:hypothetical protein
MVLMLGASQAFAATPKTSGEFQVAGGACCKKKNADKSDSCQKDRKCEKKSNCCSKEKKKSDGANPQGSDTAPSSATKDSVKA